MKAEGFSNIFTDFMLTFIAKCNFYLHFFHLLPRTLLYIVNLQGHVTPEPVHTANTPVSRSSASGSDERR